MILLASHNSRTWHHPHPRVWGLSLCGVHVRIETTLEDVEAHWSRSTVKPRECGRCARLATESNPAPDLTDSRSHG